MSGIASRINERLDELGWSQRELSRRTRARDPQLGVSESFVTNLKAGKAASPKVNTLTLVADVLGVRYGWLAHGEGEKLSSQTDRERELLDLFRAMDSDEDKDAVLRVLGAHAGRSRRAG
jgi:transcriptional regulator with XRE-family HTH domain